MGLLLQILGVICVLASLVMNIMTIVKGNGSGLGVAFLVIGILLISGGRKIK